MSEDDDYNEESDPQEHELDEPCSMCPHPDACESHDECLRHL